MHTIFPKPARHFISFLVLITMAVFMGFAGCNDDDGGGSGKSKAAFDASGTWSISAQAYDHSGDPLTKMEDDIVTIIQQGDVITLVDKKGTVFTGTVAGAGISLFASADDGYGSLTTSYDLVQASEDTFTGTKTVERSGGGDTLEVSYACYGIKADAIPAVDPTGYWHVRSYQDGEERTGVVNITSVGTDGSVTGTAELTSLAGQATLSGTLNGLTLVLNFQSEYGTLRASGYLNAANSKVAGSFYITGQNDEIQFWGDAVEILTRTGVYTYSPTESNVLTLDYTETQEDDNIAYTVLTITTTAMIWQDSDGNELVWQRDNGTFGSIAGIWENADKSNQLSFDANGGFTLEIQPAS